MSEHPTPSAVVDDALNDESHGLVSVIPTRDLVDGPEGDRIARLRPSFTVTDTFLTIWEAHPNRDLLAQVATVMARVEKNPQHPVTRFIPVAPDVWAVLTGTTLSALFHPDGARITWLTLVPTHTVLEDG